MGDLADDEMRREDAKERRQDIEHFLRSRQSATYHPDMMKEPYREEDDDEPPWCLACDGTGTATSERGNSFECPSCHGSGSNRAL